MQEQPMILVDGNDEPVGLLDKLSTHQQGLLHRAFSVFIFDTQGRMLLQQRAAGKYHGALLWTNACCSHPYPSEDVGQAAKRRLAEELGFVTELEKVFAFTYRANVENGLVEHEYDHVFVGEYEGALQPNRDEVADYAYVGMTELKAQLQSQPARFTAWFRLAFSQIEQWWATAYAGERL